jgi:hypothetical protein
MPTAAKLAAAVAFAFVALLTAQLYIPQLPKGTQLGYFRPITTAIGFAVGWFVMGPLAGRGYRAAAETGIRSSATVVFWALFGFSIYIMVDRSMKMMYDGPMEAVLGVFQLMFEYGKKMLVPEVIASVLIGGLLGGYFTEWAGKRWR